MLFYITMFICNLLIPLIMLLGGYCMYKKPPKEINGIIGYRTKMSKINKDTWFFAHDYCGRLWLKIGMLLLIISVIIQIPFLNASEDTFGNMTLIIEMLQVIVLLCSVFMVENALKHTFDDKGIKRIINEAQENE